MRSVGIVESVFVRCSLFFAHCYSMMDRLVLARLLECVCCGDIAA